MGISKDSRSIYVMPFLASVDMGAHINQTRPATAKPSLPDMLRPGCFSMRTKPLLPEYQEYFYNLADVGI